MGQQTSSFTIIAAAAVSIATTLLPLGIGGPLTLLWAFGCSVVLTVLVWRLPADRRQPWSTLTLAGWLIAIGVLIRGIHGEMIGVDQPLPSPADLVHIPAYLLFLWAAVLVQRARATRRDSNAWLDAFIVVVGFAIPLWVVAWAPFATNELMGVEARSINLVYNLITMTIVAVFLRNSATPGWRPPAYYLLGLAGVTFFVADLAAVFSSANDGVALSVVLSPMTYGLVLAAMQHRTAPSIMMSHQAREERVGLSRHLLVAFAVLSPVLTTLFWPTESTLTRIVVGALSLLLAAGVIVRLSALLHKNQVRADLEHTLSSQISRLASLESSQRIAEELPRAAAVLTDPQARISYGPANLNASFFIESSLNTDQHDCGLSITGPTPSPMEQRLLGTLVRDAELLGISADAVKTQAEQHSQSEANKQIAANERRFRALVQNSSDAVAVVCADDGIVTYMSESVERVLGYQPEDFIGRDLEWASHENDWLPARDYHMAILDGTELHQEHEFRATHADGSIRLLECVITDMRDIEGIEGLVINASDVTENRALVRNLKNAETTDPLTLLLNRNAFIREIDTAIRRSSVGNSSVAMAIVNLDDFRLVNEGYGTAIADQMLVELAHRVRQTVRADDAVARLNGDEFGVLMPNDYSPAEAEAIVDRILEELTEPVTIGGRTMSLQATAGLVNSDNSDATGLSLLRDADTALDAAKQTNRGGVVHFDQAMGEEISTRVEIRNRLRDAIRNDKLRLAYQPIVDITTGTIVSLEALARWNDPERGEIGPATFIPIAEASGTISELGEWALRTACRQVVEWEEQGLDGFTVSVNMSGHQLRNENIIARVRQVIHASGVDPARITIEITESVLIDDTDFIAERLRALRDLGIRLSIDDFGTGYSSLSYLRRYEFDVLKIDRSFVVPLADDTNKREREIVNAMIKLAQALGAVTVAEGIEESEEFGVLRTLGCDYAQGFLFWHPTEADDIPEVLRGEVTKAVA